MKHFTSTLLFITLFSLNTYSQSVGLVLSGGGARGLAHIGVIKVLEANNIPIDYITGTSMGAIVGGLYAAGYTTDEMEELFRSDEFYFWSTGKIQQDYRYFFKKREENPSWIELKMERRDDRLRILPPTNIVPQWQMDFAFMELMAATTAISKGDFDSLFVPFRCVATEVYTNTAVVLGQGDLGEAIRASMTFPFVFRPITINGMLLFDGGIVNNFPTDVMDEAFKPDIIIGHKVATDPQAASDDDIIRQITNMIQRPTNYEIAPERGILLETNVNEVGILDFHRLDYIVTKGMQTTYPMIDSIVTRIKRRSDPNDLSRHRAAFNAKKPALLFQNIQLEGISDPLQHKYIISSIKHNKNIFTVETFKKEYFKLIADEQIKSIRPIAMFNNESGYFDVHLIVEPEKRAEINVGGNISTKPINQGFVSFDTRFFKNRSYALSSNLYFGRFYSSFKIGGRIDFPTELPLYLGSYLTYNRWDFFSSSNELFFEDVRPPFIIQNESSFRNEIGFPLGLHDKFTVGLSWSGSKDEYYQNEKFNKSDDPDNTDFNAAITHAEYEKNSQNSRQYATEGTNLNFSLRYIAGQEKHIPGTTAPEGQRTTRHTHSFLLFRSVIDRYFDLNRKFDLGYRLEGVLSNKKLFTNHTSSLLASPGFYPTPHSRAMYIENFHNNNFVAGGLKTIYHINTSLHFRLEGYGFVPVREPKKLSDNKVLRGQSVFTGVYWQGLAGLVYETGLGPASLMLNYYDKENTQWYLTLNFGYVLFNKRGF
jgi:NTE family protein